MTHLQAVLDLIQNNSESDKDELKYNINTQFVGYENDADVFRKTKKLVDLYNGITRNYDNDKIEQFITWITHNYNTRVRRVYGASNLHEKFYDLLGELLYDLRLPSLKELKDERLSAIGNTLDMYFLTSSIRKYDYWYFNKAERIIHTDDIVNDFEVSPYNKMILSLANGRFQVWDSKEVIQEEKIFSRDDHMGFLDDHIEFFLNEDRWKMIALDQRKKLVVCDAKTLDIEWEINDAVYKYLLFDKNKLLVCLDDNTMEVLDALTGQTELKLDGHHLSVTEVLYVNSKIVSISDDLTMKSWDLKTGILINSIDILDPFNTKIAVFKNGLIIYTTMDGINTWNPRTGESKIIIPLNRSSFCRKLIYARDLIIHADQRSIRVWNSDNLTLVNSYDLPTDGVRTDFNQIYLLNDSLVFNLVGLDEIKIWNVYTRDIKVIKGFENVKVLKNNKIAVCEDNRVIIFT